MNLVVKLGMIIAIAGLALGVAMGFVKDSVNENEKFIRYLNNIVIARMPSKDGKGYEEVTTKDLVDALPELVLIIVSAGLFVIDRKSVV